MPVRDPQHAWALELELGLMQSNSACPDDGRIMYMQLRLLAYLTVVGQLVSGLMQSDSSFVTRRVLGQLNGSLRLHNLLRVRGGPERTKLLSAHRGAATKLGWRLVVVVVLEPGH